MVMCGSSKIPQPGDWLAGKYRVEKVIGAGGMGCVLAAEHAVLRTRVAIKMLLPLAVELPGATERFLREAQAAATLRSEHVARVLDVGTAEDGTPFLVMEHLSGQDLRSVIRERAPLPVGEAIDYLLQACDAILEAHAQGIVHRDIKPANIFVTNRPNGSPLVKVLDFGIAKVLAPEGAASPQDSITETGQVLGSPQYMPPEQFRSLRNADSRSDIWALGIVAYELLTGERPFRGDGMAAILLSVVEDEPAPVRAIRPELPEPLATLIMRCLSKPPERRPQGVAEVIAALAPFADAPGRAIPTSIEEERTDATILPLKRDRSPKAPAPPVAPSIRAGGEPLLASLSTVSPLMPPEDSTDLNHSSSRPRRQASREASHTRWVVLGCVLILTVGAGVGGRVLTRDLPEKPASEQGTPAPPAVASGGSAADALTDASVGAPSGDGAAGVPTPQVAAPSPATRSSTVSAVPAAPASAWKAPVSRKPLGTPIPRGADYRRD